MTDSPQTTFTRDSDTGRVIVNHWDEETDVAKELIDYPGGNITRDGDTLIMTVANGKAVYQIIGPSERFVRALHVKLISGTVDAPFWRPNYISPAATSTRRA